MLKKLSLFSGVIILLFFKVILVHAEEEILYQTGTNDPVTYYGTNDPVMIPTEYTPQLHEVRAMWIATVEHIDMPEHTSMEQYKTEYIEMLDNLEAYHFNTVIFQVRPMNDAFYESTLNPWSKYLAGTEGEDPGWDVLSWMVDETHKRGMEFHAWLNPYRVSNKNYEDLGYSSKEAYLETLSEKNFARKHPEYVLEGSENKLILNPGEPQVRQFIYDTITEIVTNYDVDAIHFDDYFYPYDAISNAEDLASFQNYNPNDLTLSDWRRENVNILVKGIKDLLDDYNSQNNKGVQFGISPFGIWANKSQNPLGSNTQGGNSYYSHYADTLKWVKEEWVDYIVPQIYWAFEREIANYAELVDWWTNAVKGTKVNLYIGQGMYRYALSSSSYTFWANERQVPNQLLYNQKYEEVKGSVFFSYKSFFKDTNRFAQNAKEIINNEVYEHLAILPSLENMQSNQTSSIDDLSINTTHEAFDISWSSNDDDKWYVLYKFKIDETIDFNDPSKIFKIIYNTNDNYEVTDENIISKMQYKYILKPLDYTNSMGEGNFVVSEAITIKPKIIGYQDLTVEAKGEKPNWTDFITAIDGYGNDITDKIVVDDKNVNMNVIGDYTLKYRVEDNEGLISEATINVLVRDNEIPVISLKKDLIFQLSSSLPDWSEYIEVIDQYDGDITDQVVIDSENINWDKIGRYYIKCTITDSNGNNTKKYFDVEIVKQLNLDEDADPNNNGIIIVALSIIVVVGSIVTYIIYRKRK